MSGRVMAIVTILTVLVGEAQAQWSTPPTSSPSGGWYTPPVSTTGTGTGSSGDYITNGVHYGNSGTGAVEKVGRILRITMPASGTGTITEGATTGGLLTGAATSGVFTVGLTTNAVRDAVSGVGYLQTVSVGSGLTGDGTPGNPLVSAGGTITNAVGTGRLALGVDGASITGTVDVTGLATGTPLYVEADPTVAGAVAAHDDTNTAHSALFAAARTNATHVNGVAVETVTSGAAAGAQLAALGSTYNYLPYIPSTGIPASSPIRTDGTNASIGSSVDPLIYLTVQKVITNPDHNSGNMRIQGYPIYTNATPAAQNYFTTRFDAKPIVSSGASNTGEVRAGWDVALRNYMVGADDNGTLAYLYGSNVEYGHFNTNTNAIPLTTTVYGLHLRPFNYYGTIGTLYDLYIADDREPFNGTTTKHYGIYAPSTSATHYLKGDVGVGVVTPTAKLHVNDADGGNAFRVSNGSTGLMNVDASGNTVIGGYLTTHGGGSTESIALLNGTVQIKKSVPVLALVDLTDSSQFQIAFDAGVMTATSTLRGEQMRMTSDGALMLSAYSTNMAAAVNGKAGIFAAQDGGDTNNVELWSIDDQGNVTLQTSHDGLTAVHRSHNRYTGKGRVMDLDAMGAAITALATARNWGEAQAAIIAAGGTNIYTTYSVPAVDWDVEQAAKAAESQAAISAWMSDTNAPGVKGDKPKLETAKPKPTWLVDALKPGAGVDGKIK